MTWSEAVRADPWRRGGNGTGMWIGVATGLLLMGLAGFLVHPVLGAGVLALLVAPIFVLSPRYALLLVLAILPFDALTSVDEGGMLSLTRLFGLALLGGWIVHLLVERRPVRIAPGAWRFGAFVAFAAVSVGWAADPGVSLRAVATLVQLLLLAVMAADVLREPRDVERAIDVLLAASVVVALLVLFQMSPDSKRATLVFAGDKLNSNYLAASLVFPAIAALGLGTRRGETWGWLRVAAVVPIVLALFLTGSRGGGVAFVGGLLLIGALRRGRYIGLVIAALALAVLLPVVVPQSTADRLWSRYTTAEQDRLSGRVDIWRVALAMAKDNPVQGTGYGGFADAFYHYMLVTQVDPYFARQHSRGNRASHNIYLGTLAELGVVGFVLLAVALATHARSLWRARIAAFRRGDPAVARLTLALLGVFASLVLFGSTIDLLSIKAPWVWFAMMQTTACMGMAARRARVAPRARVAVAPQARVA